MNRILSVAFAIILTISLSANASSAFAFRNISEGGTAPDFTLSDADGNEVSLSSYSGKIVLLILWAADTESKRERSAELMKSVEALVKNYADKGVAALSVNFDKDSRDTVAEVVQKSGATFPTLFDDNGEVYGSYGVFILPTVGIIGKDGTLKKAFGYTSDLDKLVDGEVQVLLGLKTAEQLASELEPEEVVEKPSELMGADRHMNLGRQMVERRLFDQAQKEFEAAIKLDPERVEAYVELGHALIMAGKYDEALEQLTKALELDPESADAHAGVGLVFFHKDQLDDAIDELEWAIEIHPRDAKIHYQLGLVYEKSGDQKEALRLYKRALELVFKD